MKLQQTLYGWFVLTLIGVGVVGAIQTSYLPAADNRYSNPVIDQGVILSLYAGYFILAFGLASLIGYGWRSWRGRGLVSWPRLVILRQASLVAIGVTAILALLGYEVFTWWDAILLVVALGLVELSFRVKRVGEA
jgi:hypothetical protein